METQDAPKEGKADLKREFLKSLDNLQPITENAQVMDYARTYLESLRKETKIEVEQVIGVFLKIFTNMTRTMRGENLPPEEVEQLFMSESLMLDLNNNWYRQFKPIIEPKIADCKVGLMTIMMIRRREDDMRHHDDDRIIQSLAESAWDFMPWIVFVATGSMTTYISAKEITRRMIVISPDHFGVEVK